MSCDKFWIKLLSDQGVEPKKHISYTLYSNCNSGDILPGKSDTIKTGVTICIPDATICYIKPVNPALSILPNVLNSGKHNDFRFQIFNNSKETQNVKKFSPVATLYVVEQKAEKPRETSSAYALRFREIWKI